MMAMEALHQDLTRSNQALIVSLEGASDGSDAPDVLGRDYALVAAADASGERVTCSIDHTMPAPQEL